MSDIIVATLIAEDERLAFLPRHLGPRLMVSFEALAYQWMSALSVDYHGGYWHFYDLSNAGFYMAPNIDERMRISVDGNGFDRTMSADAAGIVSCLFALNHLASRSGSDVVIESYYKLLDFSHVHPDAAQIARAID